MAEEKNEVDLDQEWVYETATTTPEYIASCFNALGAISDMDTALLTETDRKRIKQIKHKSLRIIDHCIGLLYDELFDDETN